MPIIQLKTVRRGNITTPAINRGAIRYLKGLTDMDLRASICSVTFIEPSSAHIAEPTRPVTIKAVKIGPNSISIDLATIKPVAPASPLSDS
ncbi:Uncharacterized protein AB751O23_AI_00130 [Chlamydiales bacterium SCGC AB-751-O23]|nr:Uncharacterized protein AB751O23_AI_00130 [Chlamydiales bacterium SCGC AB-751-O23]